MELKSDLSHTDSMDALHDNRVDWSLVSDEIHCPLCEYNLRGLIDPRCPECGYQSEWRDLLDARRREHPYLFETQKGRRFSAFWKTAWHGLRPWKFWSTLRADQPLRPKWLLIYYSITAFMALVAFASNYAASVFCAYVAYLQPPPQFVFHAQFQPPPPWAPPTPPPPPFSPFGEVPAAGPDALCAAISFAWPLLSCLALIILQGSMRKAKIHNVHVLRCIIYSWDIMIWLAVATVLLDAAQCWRAHIVSPAMNYGEIGQSSIILAIAATVIFVYRLTMAYWRYLRFRHVIATIVSTQIIVCLAVLAALYWLPNFYAGICGA